MLIKGNLRSHMAANNSMCLTMCTTVYGLWHMTHMSGIYSCSKKYSKCNVKWKYVIIIIIILNAYIRLAILEKNKQFCSMFLIY